MLTDRDDDDDLGFGPAPGPLRPAQRSPAPTAGGAADHGARAGVVALEAPGHDEKPAAEVSDPDAELVAGHAAEPDPAEAAHAAPRRRSRGLLPVGLFAVAAVGAAGALYLNHSARFQSTDDAFIAARNFSIAPKVVGYIVEAPVTDNEHVEAGGLIARIDDRDYRNAVALAEAQVAAAEAGVKTIDAQRAAQQAQIDAAQAQVAQAQAALVFAGQQADRFRDLLKSGSGTVLNAQQSSSQLGQQQAAVTAAQATLKLAERQLDTLDAQRVSTEASLAQARANLDQAKLNLSFTAVTAAQPGRVVSLSAAKGQLAQAGAALAMFVPDETWVVANFKETQLDAMRAGQPVEITLDAYPGRTLHGRVDSIQPGSGTAFSLLPAENATGNFVKVVQRVPVKLVVDDLPADVTLGPGMSVVPTVRVDPTPSLWERLKAAVAERLGTRA